MIGRKLAHYLIVERLGAGGMGVVYRARDEQLERDVALKVLPPEALADEAARKRFRREALALSQLNHPHICTIYEVGEAGGETYIAMEYVQGRPLSQAIPPEGLAVETALRYGSQIADALAHAHDRGLTHRDLKSANVMVTPEGRTKVLDFGLAKRTGAGPDERTQDAVTALGTVVGTLAYMAPEVLKGAPADARSDLWALGVMLHEMLSGARPFQGSTPYALSSAILRESPPPLPERAPPMVRAVIQRCLAKEPGERYQSAAEARAALEVVATGTAATVASAPAAPRAFNRRWLLTPAVAAVVLLAVLVAPALRRRFSGAVRIESIAVLPFDNLTRDPEQDFFAAGVHEQLITDLSRIRALRVISRTSVMQYSGARKPLPQIARELGVDAVVQGSVMRSGDRVRITAQLLHAPTDRHLWAESYDRDLKDVLPLQREVARNIAAEIRITLTPQEQARLAAARPVDPEIHQLVLRGHYFANKGGEQDLKTAIGHFEQAVARDPNHAPAHAGLALAYRSQSTIYLPPREVMPKAKAAARRAIELDDTLADAHLQLAWVLLFYDWDWPAAERQLQRALGLSPSLASAHVLYASYFTALGRPPQALDELAKAEALDPLSLNTQGELLFALLGARQFDRVIEQTRKVTEREPNFAFGYASAAMAWTEKGEHDKAVAEMQKAIKIESNTTFTALLAHVQAARGDRRAAGKLLAELDSISRRRYVCAYEVSHAYVTLGDNDRAFQWLNKGLEERADCMVWLLSEPWMDPVRTDRRYKGLLDAIGLATAKAGLAP